MGEKSNKIVIFTSAFRPFVGGSEIAIEEVVKRLPEFFFEIITPKCRVKLAREESGANFRIRRVGLGWKPFDKLFFPMLGYVESQKIPYRRTVHSYQASYGGGAGWLVKTFYPKTLFILTMQEGKELDKQGVVINFFRRLIIRKADVATAISNYLAGYLRKVNKNLPVEVIPNGVDINNFSREFSYGELTGLDDKLGIKPDDKVIISASRLVKKNGLDLLIRAMAVLKNKFLGHNFKLILAGEGSEKQNLMKLADELGVKDSVLFAGQVSHHELPLYFKISDIFVRPSRSEGLGNSFLEAMAAGLPVIGTKVGGIPDFLEDRKTGLFTKLEPEDIASKIFVMIENSGLRQEIIQNARRLVGEKYGWDKIASEFEKLYTSR